MDYPYWRIYRLFHTRKAEAIKALLGPSIVAKSDQDMKEIVDSIGRLTYKYECPISRLKEAYFSSLSGAVLWNPILLKAALYSSETIEAPKEAREYEIKIANTGHYLIATWIRDRIERIEEEDRLRKERDDAFEKMVGATMEQIKESAEAKLLKPLAPCLGKGNNLENKVYKIAEDLVNYIEYYYKPMDDLGRREAIIYCCILLIKFRSDYSNELYVSDLCDRVFIVVVDALTPMDMDYDEFFRLFNQRVIYWSDPYYPMEDLWRSFYVEPFMDLSKETTGEEPSDEELKQFSEVILSMKVRILSKHGDYREMPGNTKALNPGLMKECGLTQLAIDNLTGSPEPEAKPLVIKPDYSIYVQYEDYKCKFEFSPIEKAIYLLYWNHPEGIAFKGLVDYKAELTDLYKKISRRTSKEAIEKTISRLINPYDNSINEKCARIKKAIEESVPKELVHWYIISGEKGGVRKIVMKREM